MNEMKWHRRFIGRAEEVAQWSKDPSTKVGCVIVNPLHQTVISEGFNGFARGVQEMAQEEAEGTHGRVRLVTSQNDLHPERWERPQKYLWVVHAEMNAVLNAARVGVSTHGCWAYMNYEPVPCEGCANALVQAGIKLLVGPDRRWDGKGTGAPYEVGEVSRTILREGQLQTLALRT